MNCTQQIDDKILKVKEIKLLSNGLQETTFD